MGHLLGTGLLDADEEQTVADVLAGADLNSGFGLRTLSTAMTRFNPLGYHTGSVWPHDTAMTIQGLYATGHAAVASSYVDGLIRAAEAFDYRLPELYGGRGTDEENTPTPYPLSCRPQAWAAASAVAAVVAALGIEPDVPGETLVMNPAESPWQCLEITGLRLGDDVLSVRVEDGVLTVLEAPQNALIEVRTPTAAKVDRGDDQVAAAARRTDRAEAPADRVRADGVAEVQRQADQHRADAEQQHLGAELVRPGVAGGELREERQEEQRGLGVEQVHQYAVAEDPAERCGLDAAGVLGRAGPDELQPEVGEVQRAGDGDRGEQRGGGLHERREAERGDDDVDERAGLDRPARRPPRRGVPG